jgi:DNA-binding NtrC family response regulator
MLSILLVDDEPSILLAIDEALRGEGYDVVTAFDGLSAQAALATRVFDAVVCDVRLPKVDGLSVLKFVRRNAPSTKCIMMTAYATVPDAVAALKDGAVDYLAKPFELEDLLGLLSRVARERELTQQFASLRAEGSTDTAKGDFIGRSPVITRIFERIAKFAASDAPVLVTGESGTGKELVAKALHSESARHSGPFVAVNCPAFPDTLLEAELFGHERGAFTGAVKRRDGRFKAAEGGTLLLDEVAELRLGAQSKLLRVLEEGTYEPLGTNRTEHANVRLVSATHRNLKQMVEQGLFREDLYYRLNTLSIHLPALRERGGDRFLLLEHLLRRFSQPSSPPAVTARALAALAEYPFPGNVRELSHAVQHAVVVSEGRQIDLEHLPSEIAGPANSTEAPPRTSPRLLEEHGGGELAVAAGRNGAKSTAEQAGVLVVSDRPACVALVREAANGSGLLVADSAEHALELIRQTAPTLVMVDLELPGRDGWALVDRIKHDALVRHTPVAVLGPERLRKQAFRMGALVHLETDASPDEVITAVREMKALVERPGRSLLLLDPDKESRSRLGALLVAGEVSVVSVGTVDAAVAALAGQRFDCIVLQIGGAKLTGLELLSRARREPGFAGAPVVIFDESEPAPVEQAELDALADDWVIQRAHTPERLLLEVSLFLHRRLSAFAEQERKMIRRGLERDPALVGRKILVVDDDVRNIFALTAVLERHGMVALFAESARDGIGVLERNPDVDAVLMDVMMPEMDGYEAIGAIRSLEEFAAIPIVAVTAKAMKGDREKCLAAGASDYIAKPVNVERLLTLLRVWLTDPAEEQRRPAPRVTTADVPA